MRVVPGDPSHIPTRERAEALLRAVQRLVPDAARVSTWQWDHVRFIDAGANFESVTCPRCGAPIDVGWWGVRMNERFRDAFRDLVVEVPCCGDAVSLNDLDYRWPQAFARWAVEAEDPGRGLLDDGEHAALSSALGCEVRVIWTHT